SVMLSHCVLTPNPLLFFSRTTSTTPIYTLSLHDALPIWAHERTAGNRRRSPGNGRRLGHPAALLPGRLFDHQLTVHRNHVPRQRSEEHTSELQSRFDLVCRLLLEKKKKNTKLTDEADRLS